MNNAYHTRLADLDNARTSRRLACAGDWRHALQHARRVKDPEILTETLTWAVEGCNLRVCTDCEGEAFSYDDIVCHTCDCNGYHA